MWTGGRVVGYNNRMIGAVAAQLPPYLIFHPKLLQARAKILLRKTPPLANEVLECLLDDVEGRGIAPRRTVGVICKYAKSLGRRQHSSQRRGPSLYGLHNPDCAMHQWQLWRDGGGCDGGGCGRDRPELWSWL